MASQSGSPIFQCREALLFDATPPQLPHRTEQLKELTLRFKSVLEGRGVVKLHITGDVGTGKTVVSKRFGEELIQEGSKVGVRIRCSHINMAYLPITMLILRSFGH